MNAARQNIRGAGLMMIAMACFVANDAFVKGLSGTLPLFQLIFLRSCMTVVLMVILAAKTGALRFRLGRRDRRFTLWRSLAEVGASVSFIAALFHMPLANITAILQALPLTITLAGALFLRDAVGWRRMLAILAGFCGVMLILRPSADGFDTYAILGLVAVGFVTLRDLMARQLSPETPSLAVALYAAVAMAITGAIGSTTETWVMPNGYEWAALMAAALLILGGYTASIGAMRVGDLAVVTPFRYTGMVFALILGFVFFGDWPDWPTFLGATIVVAAGLFTLFREQRLARINLETID